MRVSRAQAAANRERILDVAARRFRERGFDDVAVAEVMQAVGLTHGAFYAYFESKEALMAEASGRAVTTMLEQWTRVAEAAPARPLAAIAGRYLTVQHRDDPGTGCLMAALGPEVSRQRAPVRQEVTDRLKLVLAMLTRVAPGRSAAAKRRQAMATFTSMVGAMVVARAANDEKLSREVLAAAARLVGPRSRQG